MSLEWEPSWGAELGGGGVRGRTRAAHQSSHPQPLPDSLSGFQQSPGQAPRGHQGPRRPGSGPAQLREHPSELGGDAAPLAWNAGGGCRWRHHGDRGPRLPCLRGHRSRASRSAHRVQGGGWRCSRLPRPSLPRLCRKREQALGARWVLVHSDISPGPLLGALVTAPASWKHPEPPHGLAVCSQASGALCQT